MKINVFNTILTLFESVIEMYVLLFTEVPQPPTAFRASDVAKNSLTLSWEPPIGDDTITGYIIEKKKEHSDEWTRVARVPGKVRTHNVTGLTPGGTFSFRVAAENPAGTSEPAELPVAVELKGKKGEFCGCFENKIFYLSMYKK